MTLESSMAASPVALESSMAASPNGKVGLVDPPQDLVEVTKLFCISSLCLCGMWLSWVQRVSLHAAWPLL